MYQYSVKKILHPFDHSAVCVCKLLKSVRDQGKKKTAAASSEEEQRAVFFLCYEVMLDWLWNYQVMLTIKNTAD